MGLVLVQVVIVPEAGGTPPPVGAPVRVELRDTSLADGPSRLVAAVETTFERTGSGVAAHAALDVDDDVFTPRTDVTVWARSPAAGSADRRRVAAGDWITMESYPVRQRDDGHDELEVTVRRVG